MGVVSKLLGVAWLPDGGKPAAPPVTSPPDPRSRTCWRCEVGWHGEPWCWMCGADVRQPWKGGL